MPAQPVLDVISEVKEWLDVNWEKITLFWLYADWRNWARLDLYAHLEKGMCKELRKDYPRRDYTVSHSVCLWNDTELEVDLRVGPAAEQKMHDVSVWICAAKPTENDTSFSNFVDKFRKEWEVVSDLTKKNGVAELEGGKLLFLGIGEKGIEEDDVDFGGLKPDCFGFGGSTKYEPSLYVYYLWLDLA